MNSPEQNQELLLRYLARELSAEEEEALELRLFSEVEFSATMREARDELLEAYAAGKLDAGYRASLERVLLSNPEQRQAAEFARVLRQRVNSANATEEKRDRWTWPAAVLAACLAIVLLSGVLWKRTQSEQSRQMPHAQASAPIADENRTATHDTSPSTSEPAFVILLGVNHTRGAEETSRVKVPAGLKRVTVQVLLNAGPIQKTYKVLVRRQGGTGEELYAGLTPRQLDNDRYVEFEIPRSHLISGTYTFSLHSEEGADNAPVSYRIDLVE